MTTIKDVAKLAGVNISTVSRALSGTTPVGKDTKQKVMHAVKQLGYRPNLLAKGLKEGKTKTIGLIIPNIRSPIFPEVARGVEEIARKYGYAVILCNTDDNIEIERNHVDLLMKRFADGLIFATATDESSHILKLRDEGFPVMLLLRQMGNLVDAVVVKNFEGAYKATTFLINKGCRNIVLLNGNTRITLYEERLKGYKKALEDNGIPYDEEKAVLGIPNGYKNGYNSMKEIIARGVKFDGVFATTDTDAVGAVQAIKDSNLKVPDDVKVIGNVGLEIVEVSDPSITTMTQPIYEMGAKAMERLIKIINRRRKCRPIIDRFDLELEVRGST